MCAVCDLCVSLGVWYGRLGLPEAAGPFSLSLSLSLFLYRVVSVAPPSFHAAATVVPDQYERGGLLLSRFERSLASPKSPHTHRRGDRNRSIRVFRWLGSSSIDSQHQPPIDSIARLTSRVTRCSPD